MKKIILLIILLNAIVTTAYALETVVVKKIEIVGLQRISPETVETYLPIKPGEKLTPSQTTDIIKALYNTGFFDHIRLSRENNTLIITVVERPTIGKLSITGNSVIPKDKLTQVMNSVNVAEGRVYDRAILDKIKQSLLNQYYALGRYNARVDVTVAPMERNRVQVNIVISEGLIAKVRSINIIGHTVFTEKVLEKQLDISTPGLFTFFNQKDRFAQEKLDSSLENLRNFYLDHGYLHFEVKSYSVEMTPDRKSIFLTIVIQEGAQYTVKGFDIRGDLILPKEKLMPLVTTKPGSIFSRKSVVSSEKAISEALGNKGYISADITMNPEVDETLKQAFLVFMVRPGKLTYVRHIYFTDNTKTNDVVLRREVEQMEAGLAQTKLLDQSKKRLQRLPYVKQVDVSVVPVEDSDDQVDLNYKVTEDSAATMNFSIGYSQLDHFLVGAGINQKNFLGTGNTLGFNFTRSRYEQYYGIHYIDPYFTADGISRALTVSFSKFDPKWANSSQSYTTNQYTFTDVYSIPLGQELGVFNRLQLGYGYENTMITLSNDHQVSEQVQDFVDDHGRHFQQIDLLMGFSRDSRDRYIFPTSGLFHSITGNVFLPAQDDGLTYYVLDYNTKLYNPLPYNFIAIARGQVGYGNSFNGGPTNFPFYKNFYAGGIDSVRGYDGNTLGPRDSNNKLTGGNFLVDGSLGLVIPNHISDNLRTSVFMDAGNVYETFNNKQFDGTAAGPIRYSTGLEVDFLTPMGLINLSYARPINHRQGDHDEYFQFALGANFG